MVSKGQKHSSAILLISADNLTVYGIVTNNYSYARSTCFCKNSRDVVLLLSLSLSIKDDSSQTVLCVVYEAVS